MERRFTLGTLRMEASLLTRDCRFSIELGRLFSSIGFSLFDDESRVAILVTEDFVGGEKV